VPTGSDVDHMVDLQLGGTDTISNMSPLDMSVNRSLGAQIYQQTKGLQLGTKINNVKIGD
jgi:filamentous hemagglutinin